jgi:hypothetical protein
MTAGMTALPIKSTTTGSRRRKLVECHFSILTVKSTGPFRPPLQACFSTALAVYYRYDMIETTHLFSLFSLFWKNVESSLFSLFSDCFVGESVRKQ